MRTARRILAFFICLAGVLLPWRLRVLYSEALGWLFQFVYMNYIYIIKFILREVGKASQEGAGGEKRG